MTDLFPTFRFGDIDLTEYPFGVRFGSDRGKPEQIVSEVKSALTYGSLSSVGAYDNREVTLPIFIEGVDQGLLADAEALLVREAMKARNEFTFNPGDLGGSDLVYETFEADLSQEYEDVHEQNGIRFYTLTFRAHPWPRSAEKVETPAVAVGSTTVVDSGSSTTNWTAPYGPTGATVTVVSGAVTATYNGALLNNRPFQPFYGTRLRRTAAIDTSVDKYIVVDWKSTATGLLFVVVDGKILIQYRREPAPTAGFTRSWYKVPDATTSVAELDIELNQNLVDQAGSKTLSVDQVLKAATLPITGTARQLSAGIDPAGSVPAEGDVIVQHATAGLGQTIVYSHPAGGGYTPSISQWLTSSNPPITDASTVSGRRISLVTAPAFFDVPVSALPVGDAQLWARVRLATGSAAFVGIDYGVRSVVGSTELDTQVVTTKFNIPAAGTWIMVPLARTVLPPRHLGPDGKVRIWLLRSTVHDIEMDDAWLFAMDTGRLTVLDCGTGTPAAGTVHNRLRVSAPSLDVPFGRIEVATAADWSDSFTPNADKVLCDQTGHRFHPDGSAITTITSGATDAAVSLSHYPRWHSNAGTV